MKRIKIYIVACLLCIVFGFKADISKAAEIIGATNETELAGQIEALVSQPRFKDALWGIKVISLDSGKTIFEDHARRLMSPASNSKLYTTALAFNRLGADYHIVTPILATAKPDANGVIHGDLVIAGRADPSWNWRHAGTNFWDLFTPFINALTNAGVRHVTGDLIGDATFLHSPTAGSSWTADDLEEYYGAEISALTLNDNYTQIHITPAATAGEPCALAIEDPFTGLQLDNQTTTGTNGAKPYIEVHRFPGEETVHVLGVLPAGGKPVEVDMTVLHPATWFAAALKEALRRNGIVVDGTTRSVYWPSPAPVAKVKIGEIVSPPLSRLIKDFLKVSQNLETDLIFEHVGEMTRGTNSSPFETSEECALDALRQFLMTNDLPENDVHFDEGSGLSRNNLTTANATTALLQFMSKQTTADDFYDALPVAGVDGTLRRRFKNPPAYKNIHAKTGTLRWANALSGYVTTLSGEHWAFSLMLNRYVAPPKESRTAEMDRIAMMLASFNDAPGEPLQSQFAPYGTLIITQFLSAPFPHPERANGHTYQGKFYSAAQHYSNSDVAMFIPKGFHATDKIDFVIHFHGWRHTVASTLEEYRLIQQFAASGKNAVLIVPQGPYNTPDSFDGKLCDTNGFARFMNEAMEKLHADGIFTNAEIGNVILSGHSGGYGAMMAIADHGGLSDKIREIWLFDALYAGTQNFVAWQKNENGRLLDIYTDHGGTKENSENLMASYRTNGIHFFTSEDTNAVPGNLLTNKIVFLHTDMVHDDVVGKRDTFEEFLKTSCLKDQ